MVCVGVGLLLMGTKTGAALECFWDHFCCGDGVFLDAPMHLYKRLCPSVCQSVGRSVTLSLKLRKTAEFTKNHGSLLERTTNQGSGSINESCTQSITHSNHSYTSQGASLAYVGLVSSF